MPLPGQSFTIDEFGTGVVTPSTSRPLYMGYSSLGTSGHPNTLVTYSRVPDLIAGEGQGPAVEDAAFTLANVGGSVVFMPTACSVAGAAGSVTASGGGPTVSLAGTPNDDYQGKIRVRLGGALGVGKFDYTLDNGKTFSEVQTIPSGGTFAIPNTGITVTFAAGTYVLNETYSWTSVAPMWNATNLGTAFTALGLLPAPDWDFAVGSGAHATAAAGATQFAAMQTQLAMLQSTYFRHKGGMVDVGNDTAANIITSHASQVGVRVLPSYGGVVLPSAKPFPGWSMPLRRNVGVFGYLGARSLISTDLKRVRSGPIPGVDSITHDGFLQDAGLNDLKISTLRTYPNVTGFFPTNGWLKSQAGSDFRYWPHRRVMDTACNYVYGKQAQFIGEGLTVLNDGTGRIDPGDAAGFELEVNEGLRALLLQPVRVNGKKGHVTSVTYAIDRTNNVLTTGLVVSQVTVVALAYVDGLATRFSYSTAQPVLAAAA